LRVYRSVYDHHSPAINPLIKKTHTHTKPKRIKIKLKIRALKPLHIRNACGERLEKCSLHPPSVLARDLPFGVWAYNQCLAWSWAFHGCTRGEPYLGVRDGKYCRNAFGNFNKTKKNTKPKRKKEKKVKIRALIVPFLAHPQIHV
jgi:hypothetical protein